MKRWLVRNPGVAALISVMLATGHAAAPDDMASGIRVWLDGLDVANNQTLPADSATVPTWVSKAGIQRMAVNGSGSLPTYSYLGAVPQGIRFDESNAWYLAAGGIYRDNEVVRNTDIFIVNNLTSITRRFRGDTRLFGNTLNGTTTMRMSSHAPWFDGGIIWDHGVVGTGGRQTLFDQFVGPNSAINTKTLWNYHVNNSGPNLQYLARDGTIGVRSGLSYPYTQEPGSIFEVGKHVNGVLGELIVYSRNLADVERILMLNYLHARHQLPNPLPAATEKFAAGKAAGYRHQLGGIGQRAGMAVARGTTYGLTIQNVNFLDNDAFLLAAVKTLFPRPGTTTQDIDPILTGQRSSTSWYLQNAKGNTGQVTLTFDTAKVWGTPPAVGRRVALLHRGPGTQFQTIVTQPVEVTAANQTSLSFTVGNVASGEYALAELLPPDHYEIVQDGQGLTCHPKTVTVKACQDASCSRPVPYTVSGTLVWNGSPGVPFVINPGTTTGDGSTIVAVSVNSTQKVVLGVNALSLPASANPPVQCKNQSGFANPAHCTLTFNPTGFLVNVSDHRSCTPATVTVEAVQTDSSTNRCVPAYARTTRNVKMYTNWSKPASGTMAASVLDDKGGIIAAIGTAPDKATTHSLFFDSTAKATFSLSYPDAGQISLTVTDTAPNNTFMQGSKLFTAVPASLKVASLPGSSLVAGGDVKVSVSAMNSCSTPGITPNFDGEDVTLSSSNPRPGQGNASPISATTRLRAGTGAATLQWAEVGHVDIGAKRSNYLGTGMDIGGTAETLGPFRPHHFSTQVEQGCAIGNFTYAGAPFKVTVTARTMKGATTANYEKALASKVTLSNAGETRGFTNNTVDAADFLRGVAHNGKISWLPDNPTPPGSAAATPQLTLRATEAGDNPVTSLRSAGATGTEGVINIRTGRLFMSNAYGDGRVPLPLTMETRYWNGSAWQRNTEDSCTTIPASSIAMVGWGDKLTNCKTAPHHARGVSTFSGGQARDLQLKAPGGNSRGTLQLAPNVGSSAAGETCVDTSPGAAIGANVPWLAPVVGGTVTFGVYKSPLVYRRENY